jgi:hypothetical protein
MNPTKSERMRLANGAIVIASVSEAIHGAAVAWIASSPSLALGVLAMTS